MARLVIAYARGEIPSPGHDYRWARALGGERE